LVGLETRLQGHDFELYRVETEAQRALENLFEQGAQIRFRLEHVAVGDADGNFELDAVLVDDEGHLPRLHAVYSVERLFHQLADDAERRLAVAALRAAQGYLTHRVAAEEQHRQRTYRQHDIKHAESYDKPLAQLIVELRL